MTLLDQSKTLIPWGLLDTRDPACACQHLSRLFRPHRILFHDSKPDFHFQHSRAELGDFSINTLAYGKKITISAPNQPIDNYLVKFTLRGNSEVTQGRDTYATSPDTVCVLNPTSPLKDYMSADFDMLIVQLSGANIRQMLAEEASVTVTRPFEFLPTSLPVQGPVASFARLVKALCEDLSDGGVGFRQLRVSQQIERSLMSLLLYGFPHNYSSVLEADRNTATPDSLKRVEEYIHAHLAEPISLNDLVRVARCSARALQLAFRKHRGTSPMMYLRDCRLEWAHRRLKSDDGWSVTHIAYECGFTHLSKFASYYSRRYGELPSKTGRK